MQKWLKFKIIFLISLCSMGLTVISFAETSAEKNFYADRTKLITQQTELLQNRLAQAKSQLAAYENQEASQVAALTETHTSKQLRSQATLDIAVAKSNLDSINIELSESQQTINRLEKEIQEIENQLNVFSIFGLKIVRPEVLNVNGLQAERVYQQHLLALEKTRAKYLQELQKLAVTTLSMQKDKYARINAFLKSRTITQLKEQQARSEVDFQQQQSHWLQELNTLYGKLAAVEADKNSDKSSYAELQREIFYANENLNYTYLQMLVVRYQDQLRQLKIAISHSSSITLLNKASDHVQLLAKQLVRVRDLLKTRVSIIEKRSNFLANDKASSPEDKADLARLTALAAQYQVIATDVEDLDKKIRKFRTTLEQVLQFELSSRQGLPGLNAKAWLDLGAEIWLVPTLTYQIIKNLTATVLRAVDSLGNGFLFLLAVLEAGLAGIFLFFNKLLIKVISRMAKFELGHINLKRLCAELLRRNLIDIFVISGLILGFAFLGISRQSSGFLINLALVWLFFKGIITLARVCLVETMHDNEGHDVRLYYRLKWTFIVGGVVTALAVFIHQLPVIYEVKDLFDRFFLLFLLVVSVFLLKSWEVVPALILPHIDERRLYLKKIVRLLGLLIPLILLVNSAIGLFGFVNLVLTISWYESIFILVMVGYLIVRGLLIDGMMYLSTLLIRHVVNGWLWTEAFLKPLDKVLRVTLFLGAWAVLFLLYGWNQTSPVVTQLNNILHYKIVDMLNTTITLLSVIELGVIVSLLFWAARWSREFVYRLLAARTKDMGLRNSIAIFSQYSTVLLGVFICLRVLGIDFRALAVVAGAFAFGVGLGLRDLANNFVCGFLMLIERPLRVGDTVTVSNYEGEVTHIGGRAVTIRTWDHMEVLVPNAEIFSKSFTNWTAKDYIVRTVICIKINRHDNPHDVQSLIHQVLADHKDVLSDPLPEVFMKEMQDGLIEFEVRYFINLRQVKSRVALRSEVLLRIWETFENHNIKPPYPHQEIHMKGGFPMIEAAEYEQVKS